MSSYSRPVPAHLKGPRGTQPNPNKHRTTFSSTAAHPQSAPTQHRDKPTRSIASRPSHHPHSLTVDVSPYTHSHSATQPLSPTSPPSGDVKHSPGPRPYPAYSASQYVHSIAASSAQAPYPVSFPQYVNDVSPRPAYQAPPHQFAMSTYHPHMPYPPRPSHAMPSGPAHPYHQPHYQHNSHAHSQPPHSPQSPMFHPRHPSTAGSPPPPQFRPSQPFHPSYTMHALQLAGPVTGRGHPYAQSMQLSSHAPVVDSANVVSLSLFDDDDGPQSAPQSARVKPIEEEEKIEENERPSDAAQADLRATCQQFILAILTNRQSSTATPPWRSHSNQNNPIVVEYEALYSQMIALSPSLANTASDVSTGRLSGTSAASPHPSPPASSRLSVESTHRLSRERRPSRLSIISSALRARLSISKESNEQPQSTQPDSASSKTSGVTAGDESVVASPRHSFSLLMPSFSTLHAVAKVMQITKRVRKGIAAGKKDAQERKAEEAEEEDEANEGKNSSSPHPPADEEKPTHLMINPLQSHSPQLPTARLAASQPISSAVAPVSSPASPTLSASSSTRSPRMFRSRYKKQQELSQLQQQANTEDEPHHPPPTDTTARKPPVSAFSYTMPLPRKPLTADKKDLQKEADNESEDKALKADGAESRSQSAMKTEPASVAAKPAHRRNVTFAAPPAKSTTHLRSLSTLPPLPPLPANLTTRNSTASSSTVTSHTAPTSPTVRSATTTTTTKSITSIVPTAKPRITHHKFNTPSQPRPLLVRTDPQRQHYTEKLEPTEHSDKSSRTQKVASTKRLQLHNVLEEKPIKKWGRRGWPHKSRLHVDGEAGRLYWNWKGSAAASAGSEDGKESKDGKTTAAAGSGGGGKSIDLKGVRGVVPGVNPVEHKGVAFATSVLCFSVLGKERVLECECASVRERDGWMEELRLDVGEAKTRGCVWSGRVMMSIERDASIECVVAPEDVGISFI